MSREPRPGRGESGGGDAALTFDLIETYIFLGADGRAATLPLTQAFWEELASGAARSHPAGGGATGSGAAGGEAAGGSRADRGAVPHPAATHPGLHERGWFVSAYWLEADMATWERHPNGDRLVIAQTGSFTLILDHQNGGRRQRLPLDAVGSVLVPSGCWHRLTVNTPGMVLFITPTRGMEHRPV